MATKWNSLIDRIEKTMVKGKNVFVGILCILLSVWSYNFFHSFRFRWMEERRIIYVILIAALFATGINILLELILKKQNEKREYWDEDFSTICKIERRRKRSILLAVGVVLIPVAILAENCLWVGYVNLVLIALVTLLFVSYMLDKMMVQQLERWATSMSEIMQIRVHKALEAERKSDQLRIDLITNVSHDLKTPLTSMVGYLELMKKEELSDVMKDYVEVVSDKTEKLKEMINSLFSLAKASSGNVELHLEKFNVNRMLEQIMADMKDKIDESKLTFVTVLTKENTEIESDNMYFYRICQNLLENALKYSMKDSRVFVKTFVKDNGKICLEFTNTAGYPMDFKKEEILEKFARGDKERSTEGNGLGLAIVSTYTRTLGGEFDIKIDCDQFKACLEFPRGKNLYNKQ